MHEPRRTLIADYINREGQVTFSALKAAFEDISDMTLRTDLKYLDQEGRIIRIHGGAKSIDTVVRLDDIYMNKVNRNVDKKQQIAKKALQLIKPGMSLFIDCGSTLMQFAKLLPDEPFFIVTNNISCAFDIARLTQPEVYVLGGRLARLNMSTSSASNIPVLNNYNFDVAFLAATAYDTQRGFTCQLGALDECRSIVLKRSKKSVVLIDSSKIGRVFPVTCFALNEISAIISDDMLPPEMADDFRNHGIEVY